jgi:hypothetical protein
MVSAISSFDPITYLKQLNSTGSSASSSPSAPAVNNGAPGGSSTSTNAASTDNTGASSAPLSNPLNLSSAVLAVLQGVGASSSGSSLMSELLGDGGVSSTDPLSGVYAGLLYSDTQALPLQEAIQNSSNTNAETSGNDPIQSLIDNYNASLNANSQAALQEAQSMLQALPITA